MITPLKIDASELSDWKEGGSLVVAAANWWAQSMPRGRGAVPRMLRQFLPKNLRQVLVTKHGAKLAMSPRALDIYAAINRKGGQWDPYVFETCRKLLAPGDVFYDLGASVGYMTIEMAALFRGEVRCVAFEPQSDLARCVVLSAHLNGLADAIAVFDVMIGERPREETLMITTHSIHASASAIETGGEALPRQMTSIDELVGAGVIPPPDVIKMDIEGGELQALEGAQAVIREHQPHIVFEINTCAARFGYTREDVFNLLRGLADYEFLEVRPDFSLEPVSDAPQSEDVLARSVDRLKSREASNASAGRQA